MSRNVSETEASFLRNERNCGADLCVGVFAGIREHACLRACAKLPVFP